MSAVMKDCRKHQVASTKLQVTTLSKGADIRRAGHAGVTQWMDTMRSDGFDSAEHTMRVFCGSAEEEKELIALVEARTAKLKAADIDIPVGGVVLADLDPQKFPSMKVIDGMHRTVALQQLHAAWLTTTGKNMSPHESPYLLAKVSLVRVHK
jgi:hypothetical protein